MENISSSQLKGTELSPETAKKRQKIALACDTCRLRKVRCDGALPVCGLCAKRKDKGVGCAYSRDKRKSTEPLTRSQPVSHGDDSSSLAMNGQLQSPEGVSHLFHPDRLSSANRARVQPPVRFSEDTITPQEDPAKGIDSMIGVGGDGSNSQQFFGSSSAGSFMKQIKSAIDVKFGIPQPTPSETGPTRALYLMSPPYSHSRAHEENIEYVLPSRKTADNLTSIYWTLVHSLYPFFDRHVFEDAYESIWSGSQTSIDERMLMCTLNVMFALACQLSQSIKAEQRGAMAKVYFKRAQELLRLDLWEVGSIELIQCLLLMGQYLQSTTTPHQCWMVIGHAIRIAQGLGLHLSETSEDLQSPRDREVARRVWHGCIMMDRILSMTFGRPTMISKSLSAAVPLPAMTDDELLDGHVSTSSTQADEPPSMMAFYVKSLQLYSIINDILLALYQGHQEAAQKDIHGSLFHQAETGDIARVFRLDQALMKWGSSLPSHLRLSSLDSAQNDAFLRQAVVCRARFLHARILLFRPIMSESCLPQSFPSNPGTAIDESLSERVWLQCSVLCLRTAHDMIDLIYANLDVRTLTGPLPAWWYCVLYIYTAATILLAARLRPAIAAGVAEYSITDSWSHAIEILKAFQCLGQSAQRCVAALEILSAKVSLDAYPAAVNHDLAGEQQRPSTLMNAAPVIPEVAFDDYQAGIDFSGITFDLNDMSWLTSLPGNL